MCQKSSMKKIFSVVFAFILSTGLLLTACKKPVFAVSFVFCNGQETKVEKVAKGKKVTAPVVQNQPYYQFVGFFDQQGNAFDPNQKTTKNKTYYAKWKEKDEALSEVGKIAKQLQTLIILAEQNDICGQKAQIASTQLVRQKKYGDVNWGLICGSAPQKYVEAVQNFDKTLLELQNKSSIFYQSESVDFVHMIATLNSILVKGADSDPANLCGYVGDLCQILAETNDLDPDDAKQYATYWIGRQNEGTFSASDFWADILALQLARTAQESNTSYANCIENVFALSKQQLVQNFVQNTFGTTNKDVIVSKITSAFDGFMVSYWLKSNGAANSQNKTAVALAFAEYILSF